MPDRFLLILVGAICLTALAVSFACFRMAMRAARQPDRDIAMFLWAAAAMAGLVVAGMSTAWILLPILL